MRIEFMSMLATNTVMRASSVVYDAMHSEYRKLKATDQSRVGLSLSVVGGLLDDYQRGGRNQINHAISRLKSNKAAALLSDRNWASATKMFTVGFELETQSTNGVSSNTISRFTELHNAAIKPDPIKYKAALADFAKKQYQQPAFIRQAVEKTPELASLLALRILIPFFFKEVKDPSSTMEDCIKFTNEQVLKGKPPAYVVDVILARVPGTLDLAPLVAELGAEQQETLTELAAASAKNQLSPEKFLTTSRLSVESYRKTKLLPQGLPGSKLIDAGTDGSVRGFEFRTIGALSVKEFVQALDVVFNDEVKHEVDVGCSFHLHVGLGKDVKLMWDRATQAHIYEYLMEHITEVPACVLKRWDRLHSRSGDARDYFATRLSTEKYSFVHFHPRFGTLEFRCFGNVNSKADALVCLRLAMRATRYALDAALNTKPHKFFTPEEINKDHVSPKMLRAIKERKSLARIMPVDAAVLRRVAKRKIANSK